MKKYKLIIIFLNLVLFLGFYNYSIVKKEKTLSIGKLVLLELAPKDPRSLMQGDYMTLRYKMTQSLLSKDYANRGYYVLDVKSSNVATRVRIQENTSALKDGEVLIKYFIKKDLLSIGADSFFFQEGQGKKFEEAKYGALRVDENGNSVLVGLYDKDLKIIE